ncbi:G patch domain-containing protein 4-like [Wyeomyia smithii]|uniref:G patch domain-containing protein 4-like n=1 Tax=Wyeomyia smithii TaxID=174621 RepID=UPI002467C209|nr:G patch domain-containing protein 4-like [Wyeomyia smithii]
MSDYLGSVALPSMKQRQKKLCQVKMKARADPVYKDSSNFGVRMLEKLGWSEGKGLGKREDGMAAPILPKLKQDGEGFGYAGEKDNHWTQHDQDFNQLLQSLNGVETPAEELANTVTMKSLEEKSKMSRARVHYKKFTRGKDLSRASEKDLANIFGKKSLEEVKSIVPENEEDEEVQSNSAQPEETNILGLTTINASVSVRDYFRNKMQSKNLDCTPIKTITMCDDELVANNSTETIDSTKKKRKNRLSVENVQQDNASTEAITMCNDELVASKSTKKKTKTRLSVENVQQDSTPTETITTCDDELLASNSTKKKRKKRLSVDNVQQKNTSTESITMCNDELVTSNSSKKKRKKRLSIENVQQDNISDGTQLQLMIPEVDNNLREELTEKAFEENSNRSVSAKNKKKKKRISLDNSNDVEQADVNLDESMHEELNIVTPKGNVSIDKSTIINCTKKREKKRQLDVGNESSAEEVTSSGDLGETEENVEGCEVPKQKSKKKDRKQESHIEETDRLETLVKTKRKKSKKAKNEPPVDTVVDNENENKLDSIGAEKIKQQEAETRSNLGTTETKVDNIDTGDHQDDDITCRVKVNILKQLDEFAFPGSNFADIVGYGLTQDVKLVKRNSVRNHSLEKHQFIRQKQTSLQRKRQMLKKISAFKAI